MDGRTLANILCLLCCSCVIWDLRTSDAAALVSCYSCTLFEVTDYADASQSDVDQSLRFLTLISTLECAESPDTTEPMECQEGEMCIMNDLIITIDYSGDPVQFSLLVRACTSESVTQTTCYTELDEEFDTVTASSQKSVTDLGQTISQVTGVSCLCMDNLCNDVDVDVTITSSTSTSAPTTTAEMTSTTKSHVATAVVTTETNSAGSKLQTFYSTPVIIIVTCTLTRVLYIQTCFVYL